MGAGSNSHRANATDVAMFPLCPLWKEWATTCQSRSGMLSCLEGVSTVSFTSFVYVTTFVHHHNLMSVADSIHKLLLQGSVLSILVDTLSWRELRRLDSRHLCAIQNHWVSHVGLMGLVFWASFLSWTVLVCRWYWSRNSSQRIESSSTLTVVASMCRVLTILVVCGWVENMVI